MSNHQLVAGGAAVVAVLCVAGSAVALPGPLPGVTSRVSVSAAGTQGNGGSGLHSSRPAISADARFVAFDSAATNLVPGDTNNRSDVFVRDRLAGVIRRVSVGTAGQGAGGTDGSFDPAISADGRFVAFDSDATNLVPRDTNGTRDVFVSDRLTGVIRRVSLGAAGQGNAMSLDPAISADGRYVAFVSDATNLVPRDTNGAWDVFVWDRLTGVIRRGSVGAAGQGNGSVSSFQPSLSADGRFVAFGSAATNLVPHDTNATSDVFVRDLVTGVTRWVSVSSKGRQADGGSYEPVISADGRMVAFDSDATNLVRGDTNRLTDVFVRDLPAGVTRRVSVSSKGRQANHESFDPAISAAGRFVAFDSCATTLVPGLTYCNVFLRDRLAGVTRVVSVSATGREGIGFSYEPAITADGRSVAFTSDASNLVSGDTNWTDDVFVRDPLLGGSRSARPPAGLSARTSVTARARTGDTPSRMCRGSSRR